MSVGCSGVGRWLPRQSEGCGPFPDGLGLPSAHRHGDAGGETGKSAGEQKNGTRQHETPEQHPGFRGFPVLKNQNEENQSQKYQGRRLDSVSDCGPGNVHRGAASVRVRSLRVPGGGQRDHASTSRVVRDGRPRPERQQGLLSHYPQEKNLQAGAELLRARGCP